MNLIVALSAEAKPIVEYLGLQKYSLDSPFTLFHNEKYQLIVSGIGKQNMAHAISFLHGRKTYKNAPWLNIGLAGHGNAPLGKAFQIAQFSDQENEQKGYPPQVYLTPIAKTFLKTCNEPSVEYKKDTAYDMEGSAFFKAAYRYSVSELVQSIKIISDNPEQPVSRFDKSLAQSLISQNMNTISNFAVEMMQIASEISPSPLNEKIWKEIKQTFSISETQSHQIKKAIRQSSAIGIPAAQVLQIVHSTEDTKSLIFNLNQKLEEKNLFS